MSPAEIPTTTAGKPMPGVKQPQADPKEERLEGLIALGIVILVIAAIAWWVWSASRPVEVPEDTQRYSIPLGDAPRLGPDDAAVTVVIFSDFECPYCGESARATGPVIEEMTAAGELQVVFKQFPLNIHPKAARAAQASMCAYRQDRFWEYHDALYARQDELEIGQLEGRAETLGLDMDRFRSCMTSEAEIPVVAADRALGAELGVTGTPTFFFNGRRVTGALSAEEFQAEIAKETQVNP